MEASRSGDLERRIRELEAIRRGFALHLGESLFEQARVMPELREGRERLFAGIELCDEQLARAREELGGATCPACGAPVGPGHKYCVTCGHRLG